MDISKNNPNPTIITGVDFIVGDITWDENLVESQSQTNNCTRSITENT